MLAVRYRLKYREFLKRIFRKYEDYDDFKFLCPTSNYIYYIKNNRIKLESIDSFKEKYKNVKIIDPNEEI